MYGDTPSNTKTDVPLRYGCTSLTVDLSTLSEYGYVGYLRSYVSFRFPSAYRLCMLRPKQNQ